MTTDIYSVASVRAIDRAAIDGEGIPGYTLMCRAAEHGFAFATSLHPDASRWLVVCGAGNNAGDGYVVARLALAQGFDVEAVAVVSPDKLQGDARIAFQDYSDAGGKTSDWTGELDTTADLVIDALLGSGLVRDVEGRFAAVVDAMNQHSADVIALDIPSGVDGDTGEVRGVAVSADATVTFVGLKSGLFLADGPAHTGVLEYSDLDIPPQCFDEQVPEYRLIDDADLESVLPARNRASNKGDFGHVLIVGGGPGMPGAVVLAGIAALRSGAGKVTVATSSEHVGAIIEAQPELMYKSVGSARDVDELLSRVDSVVVGPGLGTSEWGRELYQAILASDLPKLLDADALNLLAENPVARDDWILTPHPGEAARLLACSVADIQGDRRTAVTELQRKYGGVVVLKGANTLIKGSDPVTVLCISGNPGMASPGMGDVLAGVIGTLRAQGHDALLAASVGVELHARAGDLAALDGERGLLASDLFAQLRAQVNR